jgi:hypothetical protein
MDGFPGSKIAKALRVDPRQSFRKKALSSASKAPPPPAFYAAGWSVPQLTAFTRQYVSDETKSAVNAAKNKQAKVALLNEWLRANHSKFSNFESQREMDSAVENLVKSQNEVMERLFDAQRPWGNLSTMLCAMQARTVAGMPTTGEWNTGSICDCWFDER